MKQFPFLYEPDIANAGTYCLKMIAKFHGESISTLLANKYQEANRISLLDIVQMAESIGFETLSAKMTFEDLKDKAPMPCIIHWQAKHFIVVYKVSKNYIFVADPTQGKNKYRYNDFIKSWCIPNNNSNSGIVIIRTNHRFFL